MLRKFRVNKITNLQLQFEILKHDTCFELNMYDIKIKNSINRYIRNTE